MSRRAPIALDDPSHGTPPSASGRTDRQGVAAQWPAGAASAQFGPQPTSALSGTASS